MDFLYHALMAVTILFTHPDIPELVNLQNRKGEAVPYQVRQFVILVEEYALTLED